MPQYRVPQFVEIEDKIIGPLTIKQFIYLAGGAGIAVVLFMSLPLFLSLPIIAPVAALSLALAFYKVNDRPFIAVLEAALKHFVRSKLYIWKREDRKPQKAEEAARTPAPQAEAPRLTENKLKNIAWSLDVQDSIYAGQKINDK